METTAPGLGGLVEGFDWNTENGSIANEEYEQEFSRVHQPYLRRNCTAPARIAVRSASATNRTVLTAIQNES